VSDNETGHVVDGDAALDQRAAMHVSAQTPAGNRYTIVDVIETARRLPFFASSSLQKNGVMITAKTRPVAMLRAHGRVGFKARLSTDAGTPRLIGPAPAC
jgi:hypothetical protein